jgi:hypothetical protein
MKINNLFRVFCFPCLLLGVVRMRYKIPMMEENSSGKMARIFIGTLVIVDCVQDSDRGNIFLP